MKSLAAQRGTIAGGVAGTLEQGRDARLLAEMTADCQPGWV